MRSPRFVNAHLAAGLALLACVTLIPFLPSVPKDELVRTTCWSLVQLASFAGWGALVAELTGFGSRPSIWLQTVWGASLLAAVGGLLAATSLFGTGVAYVMMLGGVALLGRSMIASRVEYARTTWTGLRATRLNFAVACLFFFAVATLLILFLGGLVETASNPNDDDVAYYPFARELLQRGTMLQPFSFRRMSTLGGQTFFHALLLPRIGIYHLNAFDRAVCVMMVAGLLLSSRVHGKRPPFLARFLSVVLFLALPVTAINSASYYSGVAFFLGLYQTLELLPKAPESTLAATARRAIPLALTAAATCTLRQNYQATVAFFLFASYGAYVFHYRKAYSTKKLLLEAGVALGLVGLFVLPWLVLLYRSNDTFLFPVMPGTFRPGVAVKSQLMTAGKLFRFFVEVWLSPEPIPPLPLFLVAGLVLSTRHDLRRSLQSQWLSGFVSIVLLAVSFSLSDAANLARYDYGFLTASALLTWHAASLAVDRKRLSLNVLAPAAICLIAILYTLEDNALHTRGVFATRLRDLDELLRRTAPAQAEPPVAASVHRLQESIPAGAPVATMIDFPLHFDFARNKIHLLDLPATASPDPSIPAFRGPEPVAKYLLDQGIRYVVVIRPDHATWLYRRDVWFDNMYHPDEIWRIYAPYILDVIENFEKLTESRQHLRDEANMVVLDLEKTVSAPAAGK